MISNFGPTIRVWDPSTSLYIHQTDRSEIIKEQHKINTNSFTVLQSNPQEWGYTNPPGKLTPPPGPPEQGGGIKNVQNELFTVVKSFTNTEDCIILGYYGDFSITEKFSYCK